MLVLSRRPLERISIGDDIEIVVLEVARGNVRIGVHAPRETPIHRSELLGRDPHKINLRLVWDPLVCDDSPVVRNTRVTASVVADMVRKGHAFAEITREFGITIPDVRECLAYVHQAHEGEDRR